MEMGPSSTARPWAWLGGWALPLSSWYSGVGARAVQPARPSRPVSSRTTERRNALISSPTTLATRARVSSAKAARDSSASRSAAGRHGLHGLGQALAEAAQELGLGRHLSLEAAVVGLFEAQQVAVPLLALGVEQAPARLQHGRLGGARIEPGD